MPAAIRRLCAPACVALACALLPAAPALAQGAGARDGSGFPDLVPVAVWTAVVAGGALLVTSIAYLYRRERGLDEPRPNVPIPFMGDGSDTPERDAAGHALPEHITREHAPAGHDDATEQAALLHGDRH